MSLDLYLEIIIRHILFISHSISCLEFLIVLVKTHAILFTKCFHEIMEFLYKILF